MFFIVLACVIRFVGKDKSSWRGQPGSTWLITKRQRGASIAGSGLVDRKSDRLCRVVDKLIVILMTEDREPSCSHQVVSEGVMSSSVPINNTDRY